MTSKEFNKQIDDLAIHLSLNNLQTRFLHEQVDALFLDLLGQNEPLIGDSDQFKITENNKVVRNRVRSELRQIIGKGKS